MASRCHKRVEDESVRTEKGQLFVNANGTLTSVRAARTQRGAGREGAWVAPDTGLRRRLDGSFAPAAAA